MAHPPRRQPLEAAPRPSRLRSTLLGLAVGVATGIAAVGLALSIVAIPLFLLATTDPEHGVDRDLVRTGLVDVAIPVGLVTGLIVGVLVGIWYGRGGRLPTDRTPLHDR
jgi:hypothetical protein